MQKFLLKEIKKMLINRFRILKTFFVVNKFFKKWNKKVILN